MAQDNMQCAADLHPTCPVCLTAGAEAFSSGQDRLCRVVKGVFCLFRCPACRCIFQFPLPPEDRMASFYPNQYWWTSDVRESGSVSRFLKRLEHFYRELVAMDHLRFLESCVRRSGGGRRLLDIGCGTGLVLYLAGKHGFVPFGMDVSEQAVVQARGRYLLNVRQGKIGDDIWPGEQFDIVTMFHVLEHLPNPRAALRYAAGMIKPGGSLVIQVPNVESIQSRIFRKQWYGLDVPRHIINFSPQGLDLLLRESGFRVFHRARFSLRDNPASIASSLAPGLDPVGRAARESADGPLLKAVLEAAYLGLVTAALPLALLESALGRGGTVWVHAGPA